MFRRPHSGAHNEGRAYEELYCRGFILGAVSAGSGRCCGRGGHEAHGSDSSRGRGCDCGVARPRQYRCGASSDQRHYQRDAPVKAWREAYRLFKTKKGARCSIENLLKRVLKGKPVGHITPAVDIYNTVSLTYALPVGGEDLHAIEGDLRLKVTDGGDAFLPLGEEADDPTLPGELAYIDDAGAVCRCWNWRDGVRTALSDDSADAFLAIECVEPEQMGDCQAAIDRLAELLERYLGATVVVKTLVTRDNSCVEL